MRIIKLIKNPYTSILINFAYAIANCILGFFAQSRWFVTVGAYYIILSTTRFCVLQSTKKAKERYDAEPFVGRITGILLVVLSFCLIGMNILSAIKDRGIVFHEIIMISIATYTFAKITIAITGMIKAKHYAEPGLKALRNISLADACVSIYAMQRSMLVSFPGMKTAGILLMNILTGTAVWIVVLFLGINLIGGKYVDMAKSKIAKANEKIATTVTKGYKKIENSVVNGYKKIESGVVNSYKKIEDKFVDAYLAKDGETVEEAKERLKKQTNR